MPTMPRYPFSGAADAAKEGTYRKKLLLLADYIVSGYSVTTAYPNANCTAGIAFIAGIQVGDGSVVPDSVALTNNDTNRIYLKLNGTLEKRDSGTPGAPANSILLATITTSGGAVTGNTPGGTREPTTTGPLTVGGLLTATGVNAGGQRVRNVAAPTTDGDAAVVAAAPATNRVPYFDANGKLANSANFTFDGTMLTVTGKARVTDAAPEYQWRESDAAADAKEWAVSVNAGLWKLQTHTDAGAVQTDNFIVADRSGKLYFGHAAAVVTTGINVTASFRHDAIEHVRYAGAPTYAMVRANGNAGAPTNVAINDTVFLATAYPRFNAAYGEVASLRAEYRGATGVEQTGRWIMRVYNGGTPIEHGFAEDGSVGIGSTDPSVGGVTSSRDFTIFANGGASYGLHKVIGRRSTDSVVGGFEVINNPTGSTYHRLGSFEVSRNGADNTGAVRIYSMTTGTRRADLVVYNQKVGVALNGADPLVTLAIGDPNTGINWGGEDTLDLTVGGTAVWRLNSSGHLVGFTDATYNIGGASNRVNTVYTATVEVVGGNVNIRSAGATRYDGTTGGTGPVDWRIKTSGPGAEYDSLLFEAETSTGSESFSSKYFMRRTGFYAISDNANDLGLSTNRWANIHGVNGYFNVIQAYTNVHARSSTTTNGYISMSAGAAAQAGYLEIYKSGPTRIGYLGYNNTDVELTLENSAKFKVTGGAVEVGGTTLFSAGGYRITLATGNDFIYLKTTADASDAFRVSATNGDVRLHWGGGSGATDISMFRGAASRLDVSGSFFVTGNLYVGATDVLFDRPSANVGRITATTFRVNGTTFGVRGVDYVWPSSQGGANTFLKNDGSGNVSWASASLVWAEVSGAFTAGATGEAKGYINTSASNITGTLPNAPAVGTTVRVVTEGGGKIKLLAQGTDNIRFGSAASADAGYAESTAIGDALEVVYRGGYWLVVSAVGTWSVV